MRFGYFRIALTLLIVTSIAILFQLMGVGIIGIWALMHGTGIGHQSVMSELAATGISQILVMLLGTYFLIKIFRQHPITTLRLEGFSETPVAAYLLAIPTIFAAQFVGSMIAVLWEHLLQYFPTIYHSIKNYEDLIDEATKGAAISANTLPHALIVLLTIAIIPPLAEEVVFRGFAQTNIERSGKYKPRPYVAIIWASLAFAAMHLQPIELPGLLVLGLTLGWLSYRTNNLLVGSVAHAANNGIIVLTLMMLPQSEKSDSASSLLGNAPTSVSYALTVLAITLPLFLMCLYFYNTVTRPLHARYNSQTQYEEHEDDLETEYSHLETNDQ